jgi:hypothetical protein
MIRTQVGPRSRARFSTLLFIAGGLVACNDDNGGPSTSLDDPTGIWEQVSGELPLLDEILPSGVDLRFVAFQSDRSGALHAQMPGTGTGAWCQDLIYSRTVDGGLVLQVYDDAGNVSGKVLVTFSRDGDTLRLGDGRGHEAVFAARDGVPDLLSCFPVQVMSRRELGNHPALGTGLAYDGASLFYTREDPESVLDRIDPDTGAPGQPLSFSLPFTLVHATEEESSFWTVCRCSPGVAVRRDPDGEELDRVDTQDFDDPINIRALAYDDAGNNLWLHGLDGNGPSRLLRIDSDADPNVLLRSVDLDLYLEGMTWSGNELWAIDSTAGRQVLVEIDPMAGQVVKTFRSPDPDLALRAVGAVGNRLFLLARDRSSASVFLLEVAR